MTTKNLLSSDDIFNKMFIIRESVNDTRTNFELRQNQAFFYQLCVSMDLISDTEDAISAYEQKEYGENKSAHYLAIFGLMQAWFVQQDAVKHLAEALDSPIVLKNYPHLEKIREIRNDLAGHPTKRGFKKLHSYHYISQPTLTKLGCQLVSLHSDGTPPKFRNINTAELLQEQRESVIAILEDLSKKLDSDHKKHKEEFSMKKLVDIFPGNLDYCLQKVYEGIRREDYREMSQRMLAIISKAIDDLKISLEERSGAYLENLEDSFELIDASVDFFNRYLGLEEATSEKMQIEARIYYDNLCNQVKNLQEMLAEIDLEYTT